MSIIRLPMTMLYYLTFFHQQRLYLREHIVSGRYLKFTYPSQAPSVYILFWTTANDRNNITPAPSWQWSSPALYWSFDSGDIMVSCTIGLIPQFCSSWYGSATADIQELLRNANQRICLARLFTAHRLSFLTLYDAYQIKEFSRILSFCLKYYFITTTFFF